MKKTFSITALIFIMITSVIAKQNKETLVLIHTNLGDIKIKLYNETPKHRDNFIKLVNNKYYDSLLFHRVIKEFMIQAGDPVSKHANQKTHLGSSGPNYTVPAEFVPKLIHKKGAIAAARSGDEVNPLKASSGSQFYIVVGKVYNDDGLTQIEAKLNSDKMKILFRDYLNRPENKKLKIEVEGYQKTGNSYKQDSIGKVILKQVELKNKNDNVFKFSDNAKTIYKTIGGTPFLDMNYTVFGEVIEGLGIVDKIASVPTVAANRPAEDVRILSAKIVKE
jgi:cyclophilin family peptidyl-prolyl cis-trans isomerase